MKIAYLLDRPDLGGGVKVVFQHAHLLTILGHQVTVLGRGPRPEWAAGGSHYVDYEGGRPSTGSMDMVITTWWSTVPLAERLQLGPTVHFCQGYEGGLPHLRQHRREIEEIYRLRRPTFVVSPHLANLMERTFNRPSYLVPPPLDQLFAPAWKLGPRTNPWIAVQGIFEAPWKGVSVALEALSWIRKNGRSFRLLRISPVPQSDEERNLFTADRYLAGIDPGVVACELRRCDLFLFPSLEEGFGLPLLEAMASKVPAVASDIPSVAFMGGGEITTVPPQEPSALADAAMAMLDDRRRWRTYRKRGYEASRRFRRERILEDLQGGVEWAADILGSRSV